MNKRIQISKVSERFHNALNNLHRGTVISTFSKVVNVMTPAGVFTLQESSVPFTPLSLVLEDSISLKELGITPNDLIKINETEMSCNDLTFSFEKAVIIDTMLHPSSPRCDEIQLSCYIDSISDKLMEYRSTANAGGLMDISNHMEVIEGILVFRGMKSENALLNYFQSKIEGHFVLSIEMARSLASVIGLGFGLTPSCDDFLVGSLSTLSFFNSESSKLEQFRHDLIEEIRARLAKTTPISSAFLDAALSQEFSEMILNFYRDCDHSDKNIRRTNIEQIASTGHSSGIDSLNGINFGFKLISSLR
jgi:hypothetical protein